MMEMESMRVNQNFLCGYRSCVAQYKVIYVCGGGAEDVHSLISGDMPHDILSF